MTSAHIHQAAAVRPCATNHLLSLDGKLFVESCEVKVLDGEEAQQAVAEFLAGNDLVLEIAS